MQNSHNSNRARTLLRSSPVLVVLLQLLPPIDLETQPHPSPLTNLRHQVVRDDGFGEKSCFFHLTSFEHRLWLRQRARGCSRMRLPCGMCPPHNVASCALGQGKGRTKQKINMFYGVWLGLFDRNLSALIRSIYIAPVKELGID